MKTRVLIFQRLFSHYRKAFYDALAKEFDVLLLYGADASGIRNESAGYAKKVRQLNLPFGGLKMYFSRQFFTNVPDVVVLDFAIQVLNLPFLMLYYRVRKKRILLWSHGYNRRTGFDPSRRLADRYRRYLINRSNGLIVYSRSDGELIRAKGITAPVYVVEAALDSNRIAKLAEQTTRAKDESYRNHLVFIGRMTKEKDPCALIRMFNAFEEATKRETCVHFIGDGPELATCKAMLAGRPYVQQFVFHGALYNEEQTGRILAGASLVVILGAVGLAVNHALLYGVPVVTFSENGDGRPWHGPEKEHIIEAKTGFWVPYGDFGQLAQVVQDYLYSERHQQQMAGHIQQYVVARLQLNGMVERFSDVIHKTARP
jgi:glycosyltransferase involved in cell wall biosynthesis